MPGEAPQIRARRPKVGANNESVAAILPRLNHSSHGLVLFPVCLTTSSMAVVLFSSGVLSQREKESFADQDRRRCRTGRHLCEPSA